MHNWPLKVLGVSYRSAPVHLRERFSCNSAKSTQLLLQLREVLAIEEAMVLSTCNRTEVYYVSKQDHSHDICALLCADTLDMQAHTSIFYKKNTSEEAISHLFSVALGMDAQLLGDQQVLHQTKRSYQLSTEAEMAGPCLHRLMHSIFYSHKQVARETSWCNGTTSVAYAAVELLRDLLKDQKEIRVLLLGLGEIGKDIGRNLQYLGAKSVYVANRTQHKATTLAKNYGYEAIPFDEYTTYLKQVEVVVSCIEHSGPFITKNMLKQRQVPCSYLLDLSVPRSIESSVAELPGVLLYNIDDLKGSTSQTLAQRKAALPAVSQIAQSAQANFLAWRQENAFSSVIHRLKEVLEQLRKEEMTRYLKEFSAEESKKMDKVTRSLLQRIIKYPVLQLKAACKRGEASSMVDLLSELFDLEKSEPQPKTNNKE